LTLLIFSWVQVADIPERANKTFIASSLESDLEKKKLSFNDYNLPFLYVLTLYNEMYDDFDIEDNPYIQVQANHYITGNIVEHDGGTILKKCSDDQINEIFSGYSQESLYIFSQSVCFHDDSNTQI
jgi:hypothetical protein